MKTLIVEDDFVCRLVLQGMLASYGESHVAVNGREALDAFKTAAESEKPYDLICLDIMMPEVDGQTALKNIREYEKLQGTLDGCGVKIIMTTALSDSKNVRTAFHEMCDAYITKPIDKLKLMETLKSLCLI